ncbi:MAG: DUF6580 family putative transport protein [Pseudobdellovibrionaceae bacterium]
MRNTTVLIMILGAALSRWIPHAPNVTAVTALALLGGSVISPRALAVLAPVAALWLSDLVIGFHGTMLVVYGATALIAFFASQKLKSNSSWGPLAIGSLSASLFFFLVTNLGVWYLDTLYPHTADGLKTCFVMALPFLGNQVLGDLFYTGVLFGTFQLVRAWKPQLVNE